MGDRWLTEKKSETNMVPINIGNPNFNSSAYRKDNVFWKSGFAPKEFYDKDDKDEYGKPLVSKLVEKGIYAKGNCTWYAKGRLYELGYTNTPFSKNAKDWDQQAQNANMTINREPQIGCIAQSDTMNKGYGHVAIVEAINNDGSIIVTESSYAPGNKNGWDFRYRSQKYSKSDFKNYIHVPRK
jgi:surface antigen